MNDTPEPTDADRTRPERIQWFQEAKFGLFVHWGCYADDGRGEQVLYRDLMPLSEYEPLAERFRPAGDWAVQLARAARQAGAKYVVLTARHHDGYCLWDTATHEFSAARTAPGRDLIAEYVDAVRAEGLKVGLYYSVISWRWRGLFSPAEYPGDLPAMVDEMHAQVRELMSNYGRIDMLWYDMPTVPKGLDQTDGWDHQPGAAEFWRSAEINAQVRELQPHILINNRSGTPEDFGTPEQHITPDENPERAWETCMTLNFPPGWGYLKHSLANKTAGELLYNMIDAVRLGGNFLFNVGPHGDGYIDNREGDVLAAIGAWMRRHGEAVYGTRPTGIYPTAKQGPCFNYGKFTGRGNTAYFTLFYYPGDGVVISRVGPAIRSAELLTTGEKLGVEAMSNARWRITGLPENPPDPLAPVIKLEFESPPHYLDAETASWLDGEFRPPGE